ncbi:MAG: hypothetical protein ACREH6_02255 [Geminicoccaceae bacterium]
MDLGRLRSGVIVALVLAPCAVHAEDAPRQGTLDLFERSCLALERA